MRPDQPQDVGKRAQSTGAEPDRGSALVMVIFVLLLLTGMGVALLFFTQNEVKMSQANLRVKKSFFLAEAGQEDGRATLFNINGNGEFTDDLANYAGANGSFDFDPDTIQVIFDVSGRPTGLAGYGDDVPLRPLTTFGSSANPGWYAAFLTNDPAEGVTTTVDGNDLVMITGIGAGPNRSTEIVQAIVERRDILPSLPPATITLLGPMPDFRGGNSAVHIYTGNDCAGAGVPGLYVPVVGTIGSSAEGSAESGIYNGPDYGSGPYVDDDTFADLTDPTEPTVVGSGYGPIDSGWTDCASLREMIEELRAAADVYCCAPPVCGTATACVIPPGATTIFIDGNYTVDPPGGQGTLVVTGRLTYDGRATWRGMVFVVGAGEFVRNGAGNGQISGAVVVADIAGPDHIYGTADDCTGGDGGFDRALYDMSGGGNARTTYCSSDILAANPVAPYKIVNFRQR